jgi:hypothetical protein
MNLSKQTEALFDSMVPVVLLSTGVVFCGVIWLIHIFWMACIGTPPANYYLSMPYAGLSYISLCVLSFSGFIAVGLILLLCGKRKLFSLALIVSCLSIGTNTLVMKAILRKGHLMSMQGLVQGLLEFDSTDPNDPYYKHPSMVLFNHEVLTKDIRRWNEVEAEKFELAIELVSIVGDWLLATEEHTGICRFDCGDDDWGWDIDCYLEVNGEVWGKKGYLPVKIYKDASLYKILLWGDGWRVADYFYDSGDTNLISSLEDGVYLEMAPDKKSFFMYPDETQTGLSLGPFVRK